MPNYNKAVREGELALEKHEKSMQLAKLFMMEITELAGINLYMSYEEEMPSALYTKYLYGINEMLNDVPMQYILGYEWFYGRKFIVNKDVLIPRPETEELVSNVLCFIDEYYADYESIELIDVGCGSGAIGISLKLEEPKLNVRMSDISNDAIKIAQKNAIELLADVEVIEGSMLEPFLKLNKKVDVIVCNPPYIPVNEKLENSVVGFEPNIALFGGTDGLYFYKMVFDHCLELLKPKGFMAFEIGYDQKENLLKEVNTRFPSAISEVIKDMYGKDRMLFVRFNK